MFLEKIKKWLNSEYSIFILLFLSVTAFLIRSSFLFFDDIVYAFPAFSQDYFELYKGYFSYFGFFRPLALAYYFYIYEIHRLIPFLSHLIPLFFLTVSSILLVRVLTLQGLNKKPALTAGLLLMTMPFVTETYSWLSANMSIMVLFILFYQIYLIEKGFFKNKLVYLLFGMQLIAVYLYESTFFLTIALSYLLYTKERLKNWQKLAIFSISPLLIYTISKTLIKPQFIQKARLITLSEAITHWKSFFPDLNILFSADYLSKFWGLEISDGIKYIGSNSLSLIFLVLAFILFCNRLMRQKNTPKTHSKIQINTGFNFWLTTFLLSLVPLSWQELYIPFRLLVLPTITFFISLLFLIKLISFNQAAETIISYLSTPVKVIFIFLLFIFMLIQSSMVNQYINQYQIDKKIVTEIDTKLAELGFEHPYRSNLYLMNFPNNNVGRLLYGDYIYSLLRNYWSAEALLDLNSGRFARVAIDIPKSDYAAAFFSSKFPKNDFFNLRPLTVMQYINDVECLKYECLKVNVVLK